MATFDFRITTYLVHLNSKLLMNSALGGQEAVPAQAFIQCLGENAGSLGIFFLNADRGNLQDDSDNWPNRCEITVNRQRAEIFAPIEQYAMYLDILRNEDPVFAHLDSGQPFRTRIWVNEPAGEGEYFVAGG